MRAPLRLSHRGVGGVGLGGCCQWGAPESFPRELGDDVPPSGISNFGAGEAENKFEHATAGVDAGIVRYEGFNDSKLAFLTRRRSVGMCLRFYINVHFVQRRGKFTVGERAG